MSVIEANIVINIPDSVNPSDILAELQSVISDMNGKTTHVNVVQIDDPISMSPAKISGTTSY